MAKMKPENVPEFIRENPGYGKGELSTMEDYKMLTEQCDELYALMAKRRAACTKTLLDYYNPRRKWRLKPHHKARVKYCRKIVKLRNPYIWCKKKCPNQNTELTAERRRLNAFANWTDGWLITE